MSSWSQNRIAAALNGTNPMIMAELAGGFVALGDTQFLPGYSVLLPKRQVTSLNDLTLPERSAFLLSMSLVGDALIKVCYPHKINYDILGNTDNFLHAHIFPRYQSEPAQRLSKPVWLYSPEHWTAPQYQYDSKQHAALRQELTQALIKRQ
ncbi:hypothetical protein HU830_03745 [Lactobacillus sp. DCY120]|uniref:HIT domain-containing protein n=1 Tax=Bombilactobacillus apium TaxID=2675299 RepID=A0A850R1Q7_9LACO|nr:HIT domain-containing protein [Bombilactobacillus apium]NVY96290.1 hypothetical protein [Bombilactobacillus apium]